jgi:hypothetical protein
MNRRIFLASLSIIPALRYFPSCNLRPQPLDWRKLAKVFNTSSFGKPPVFTFSEILRGYLRLRRGRVRPRKIVLSPDYYQFILNLSDKTHDLMFYPTGELRILDSKCVMDENELRIRFEDIS